MGHLGPPVEDSARLEVEVEEHDDHVVAQVVIGAPHQRPSGHCRCVRGRLAAPLLRRLTPPDGYAPHHEWPHPLVDRLASEAPSHWLQVWASGPEDPGHRLLALSQGAGMPFDYAAFDEWVELPATQVGSAAAQVFLRKEFGEMLLSWDDPDAGERLTLSSSSQVRAPAVPLELLLGWALRMH